VSVIAALIPPVAVCAAFVAIVVGVRRYAAKEAHDDDDHS
jgi:hypothetical protein